MRVDPLEGYVIVFKTITLFSCSLKHALPWGKARKENKVVTQFWMGEQMFDQSFCCRQLHHSGLMDTAKIRCMGFPIRLCYLDFVYRYRILLPGIPATSKVYTYCQYIMFYKLVFQQKCIHFHLLSGVYNTSRSIIVSHYCT